MSHDALCICTNLHKALLCFLPGRQACMATFVMASAGKMLRPSGMRQSTQVVLDAYAPRACNSAHGFVDNCQCSFLKGHLMPRNSSLVTILGLSSLADLTHTFSTSLSLDGAKKAMLLPFGDTCIMASSHRTVFGMHSRTVQGQQQSSREQIQGE